MGCARIPGNGITTHTHTPVVMNLWRQIHYHIHCIVNTALLELLHVLYLYVWIIRVMWIIRLDPLFRARVKRYCYHCDQFQLKTVFLNFHYHCHFTYLLQTFVLFYQIDMQRKCRRWKVRAKLALRYSFLACPENAYAFMPSLTSVSTG